MQNLKPLASLHRWTGQFESYRVANPEDRFSRDGAHIKGCQNHHFVNVQVSVSADSTSTPNQPRHEKTCLRGLRPGKTQTGLLSYRSKLRVLKFPIQQA